MSSVTRLSLVLIQTACLFPTSLHAQPDELSVHRTLTFEQPAQRVVDVRDMDGDGTLEAVLIRNDPATLWVVEAEGDKLTTRFTVSDTGRWRAAAVSDVDQDGLPEILTGHHSDHSVRIWESSADDTFELRHVESIGPFIEGSVSGDSDGDGRREFLVARESFPSRVFILESPSDDAFVVEAILSGPGGNVSLAGVRDLDGDPRSELVFSDDQYTSIESVRVFEERIPTFVGQEARLESAFLGDTDGNGLGEIVGYDSIGRFGPGEDLRLRILESTGADNDFIEVFHGLAHGYSPRGVDVDGDGQSELWRSLADSNGQRTIFSLAHRRGSSLTEVFQSGSLLRSYAGDIVGLLSVDARIGDGPVTVVHQGNQLHLVGFAEPSGLEIPSASAWSLLAITAFLAGSGLSLLSSRQRRRRA